MPLRAPLVPPPDGSNGQVYVGGIDDFQPNGFGVLSSRNHRFYGMWKGGRR